MPRGRRYPQELIDRGVRLVFESGVRSRRSPRSGDASGGAAQAGAPGRDRHRSTRRSHQPGHEEIKKLRRIVGRFEVEPICTSWACRRPPTASARAGGALSDR